MKDSARPKITAKEIMKMKEQDFLTLIPGLFDNNDEDDEGPDELQPARLLEHSIKRTEQQIFSSLKCSYQNAALFELHPCSEHTNGVVHGVISARTTPSCEFEFSPTTGRTLCGTYKCKKMIPGISVLLEYFARNDVIVILKGSTNQGDHFIVSELHCTSYRRMSDASFDNFNNTVLQTIITRLVHDEDPQCIIGSYSNTLLLKEENDLRLLYSVIKEKLSDEQQSWVEYSFKSLKNSISRDEKGHILRALQCVLNINWKSRPVRIDSPESIRAQLDSEFYGLEKVKNRTAEIAAQIKHIGHLPRWGILLHGPAGIGKTSIARAIARALNLPLLSLDLSTVQDCESLTGSSKLYSNARPSLILERLMTIRDSNCSFLLNEIDKAAGGKKGGNPADALLTLVDGFGFQDNFLETSINTKNCFFIATCNDIERVSKPLRDRFLQIDLNGYTPSEKKAIFTDYIFPRILKENKLSVNDIPVTKDFVEALCFTYCTEPGVRDLEQAAERIIGNYLLRREQNTTSRIEYSQEDLPSLFESKKTAKRTLKAVPGIAKTAMIHDGTPVFTIIQAKHHPNGTGKLHLYGFVDTFQKDHVRIAYEYARRTAQIDFNKIDIAVCITNPIPATADNYLGMAAYMAILSDLTGKTIPEDALFLGGCDLYGNMFWDGPALGPIVDHIKHSGKTNIYGPLELAEYAPKHCDLNLVQSFDAAILFEII